MHQNNANIIHKLLAKIKTKPYDSPPQFTYHSVKCKIFTAQRDLRAVTHFRNIILGHANYWAAV